MKDIFDKLSSYNFFNYLFPGILFVAIAKYFVGYDLILENNLIGTFLYYFIGMVISRVGSLIIEPLLKGLKFLIFANYKDFISASGNDNKIELLSEVNNTYRTISSMLLLLLILKGYNFLDFRYHYSKEIVFTILLILLFVMFIFAYKKQTNYITKRVEKSKTI